MSITITHQGGVGVNGWSAIYRDGVGVAVIERAGMTGCRICSNHYHEVLGRYSNVARAREAALTLRYPDAWEVYETICQRVERARREWKEAQLQPQLMQATYDLANGSNSAQPRLLEMVAEINAFAGDRSWTGKRRLQHAIDSGTYVGGEPTFPEPPTTETVPA